MAHARLRQVTGLSVKIQLLPAASGQAYKELREVAFVSRPSGRIHQLHYHSYPLRGKGRDLALPSKIG